MDRPEYPRPEYPRPQCRRAEWLNLNGEWGFEVDQGDSGLERGLLDRELEGRIRVPFAPEAPASGIGAQDFLNSVWYRRDLVLPDAWLAQGRILLHFQAVDHDTTVWVNGQLVGRHRGGYTPFTCDITRALRLGEPAVLVVRARDDHTAPQARGKQVQSLRPYGCLYPRTTGIWQTVWVEPVPRSHLARPRITPDVEAGVLRLEQRVRGPRAGLRVEAAVSDEQGLVCKGAGNALMLDLVIPPERLRLWSPDDPHLYDLEISLVADDGSVVDRVSSYAGMRSVALDGPAVLINGERVFQRLVLDQGYWPDGGLTAPSDEALAADIVRAKQAGFNGARFHQRVAEERSLYHADRHGFLVWSELPDWGCRVPGTPEDHQKPTISYVSQWLEAIERDYSHPCIIGWCPLNETFQSIGDSITTLDDATLALFLAAKATDRSRPVLDASGYSHRVADTDVYDSHDYEQDPRILAAHHSGLAGGRAFTNPGDDSATTWSLPWSGQPYFVSEMGGIWWDPDGEGESWGYGERPQDIEEYYERFGGLCAALLDNPFVFGYCWTQLTDVYQERNGIFTFDRRAKFDLDRLRSLQSRPAAIEAVNCG